ncbi:MAG: chloride channel protein, partial [Clostridia bacterium]|nr:chloride channel protein [Clostridia bacterium]
TAITHLLGGSAGREGAAIQLGGSLGYNLGKLFHLNEKDMHIIVMSGMSCVFSALFGTPLTAAVFSLEVASVGIFHYAGLLPCIISSVVAYQISLAFGLAPVKFSNVLFEAVSLQGVIKVMVLSLLLALVSILFCTAIRKSEHYMKKFIKNPYIRAISGAVIIVILTALVGNQDYNGAGMGVIERAIGGSARPEAFLLIIIFTAITISAGFKGGEIVPTFFIGSTFGCVAGALLGLDAGFGAALGFVSLFCCVVNCPLASLVLSVEVFGAEGILYFAMAVAICYLMSGNGGLYGSQKIIYSKTDDELIEN